MGSGSEVQLLLGAYEALKESGVTARVVNMPSWELFEMQPADYRREVLPPEVDARLAVEAGTTLGWERYTGTEGQVLAIDRFGASAPGQVVFKEFGFTVDRVLEKARTLIA